MAEQRCQSVTSMRMYAEAVVELPSALETVILISTAVSSISWRDAVKAKVGAWPIAPGVTVMVVHVVLAGTSEYEARSSSPSGAMK